MISSIPSTLGTLESHQSPSSQLDPFCTHEFYMNIGDLLRGTKYRTSETVVDLWDRVVSKKDSTAMVELGERYLLGREGVLPDLGQAAGLFIDAARLEDKVAMIFLFWVARSAHENKEVQKTAIEIVRKAAEREIPEALYSLGMMYVHNIIGEQSGKTKTSPLQEDPCKLIYKALTLGNPLALAQYGYIGNGLSFFYRKSFCQKAIARGNAHGYALLAQVYKKYKKDDATSREYFRKGAEMGDVYCMAKYAAFIKETDLEKAKQLWEKIAQYRDPAAMGNLGDYYVSKGSDLQARVWYEKGLTACGIIDFKHCTWQREIAGKLAVRMAYIHAHFAGPDVPPNNKQFLLWIEKALEFGDIRTCRSILEQVNRYSMARDKREAARMARYLTSTLEG